MLGATLDELRGRGPAHRAGGRRPRGGEGGGAALQPLPRRRRPARTGDALHRRGHGHRPHVRSGLRQEPAGRRAAACPTAGTVFLSLADRDKATGREGGPTVPRARVPHRRHLRAPPSTSATTASRWTPWWPRSASPMGTDAVAAHRERRGRAGGELAAGPRAPRRRGPHPQRRRPPPGARCSPPPPPGSPPPNGIADRAGHQLAGPAPAGVPPGRRRRPARAGGVTAVASRLPEGVGSPLGPPPRPPAAPPAPVDLATGSGRWRWPTRS